MEQEKERELKAEEMKKKFEQEAEDYERKIVLYYTKRTLDYKTDENHVNFY